MPRRIHNPVTGKWYEIRSCSSKFDPQNKPKSIWHDMRFKPIDHLKAQDTEARFYAAKDKADKMTLEQLVDISEDFNVGYDVREGMFEVMLKIPMKELEK